MPADLTDVWALSEDTIAAPVPKPVAARVAAAPATPEAMLQSLLEEIAEMRREQSRRDTVLLAVACLLFASLMSYLDRLHARRSQLA